MSGQRLARGRLRFAGAVIATVTVAAMILAACSAPAEERPAPTEESPPVEAAPVEPESPEEPEEPEEPVDVEEPPEDPGPALGAFGVSAGDAEAVAAGMQVLEHGGNAVDAAVATAFAVSVVEPFASGIGGGGAAVLAWPGEDPQAYDFREVVAEDGRIPASNTGIPGFVAGMEALLEDHGTLGLDEVLAPAIALARDGTDTSETLAAQLANAAHRLPVGDLPHLYPDGQALSPGDALVQTDLAETLERLADAGARDLYEGELAASLAASIEGVDEASLAAYEVQRSTPPSGPFAGYEVHAAAPPLPGANLIQMLQIAEARGVDEHALGSADLIHTIAMAWRVAERSVASEMGDPDFTDVPVDRLTDPAANAEVAADIPSDSLASAWGDAGDADASLTLAAARDGEIAGNTTHLTVVDADGGMVSMTNTITNFWGSGQYAQGYFLNDQLGRFSIGGDASNVPEPGRRSVSWSLPALVTDGEGRPVLGVGSPGGRRIPIMLAQVLVGWAIHGQSLEEVVAAPRFHLEGADLHVEGLPPDDVVSDLLGRGYAEVSVPDPPLYFGSVQALEVDHETGEVIGAADTRREADVATGTP
jgi:gamma-glutamyltranspeptidase / glutathione hydrolase